jgi:hypothetical protein
MVSKQAKNFTTKRSLRKKDGFKDKIMSRHSFYEVVINAESLAKQYSITDRKGFTLTDWIHYGIVGWDLGSYFIQLDTDEDELPWMFGTPPDRIPTFEHFCALVNKIFDCKEGLFRFSDVIVKD